MILSSLCIFGANKYISTMPSSHFKFKQFTICHDKCAMKVGTDSVLLGAWTKVDQARNILDIGTGTGLIALMLSQRSNVALVDAIEIDIAAAEQAKENVMRSKWADRVKVLCCDIQEYDSSIKYDLIVSNPPYFVDSLKCPSQNRNLARHVGKLNYESLFYHSSRLLSDSGNLDIIIPTEVENNIIDIAQKYSLYPSQGLRVYTKDGKPSRRILLSFSFKEKAYTEHSLCIKLNTNQFSEDYINLTKEFYLKM